MKSSSRPNNQRRRRRRAHAKAAARLGASAVEFAIVANVMFVMVLACMEFARLNVVRNLSQDAAYYAARHVIVPGATADEAVEQAESIMNSVLSNGYTVNVGALDSESNEVVVTVSVDLTAVALFAPYFLPDTNLVSTVTMETERYEGFYEQ